jgi:alginate O-acetyltransferase complex protein AlgI
MLFHSAVYAVFLPTVLAIYWLLGLIRPPLAGVRAQNALLLVVSYFFYGWWDWRFVGLIFLSSLIDYVVGLALDATRDAARRRFILAASLAANLGILGFFKYYNFFIGSAVAALSALGIEAHASTLRVILPVGLSFYTFQSLTYTVGVYRRELPSQRDPIAFFAYVAFFPQLVAGPIERAAHLLPQFLRPRHVTPEEFASGLRQITWGLFCKLVVADNCAVVANSIFDSTAARPGSVALIGALFFAFQIYGDFSGYSHIALGSARLLGFELMQNFATPYFSQSIPEFWRRWHISLSTWFRDFVFIPLGGSRVSKWRYARNIIITFTISGLWHGANWTFVVWGFLNGLYYLPHIFFGKTAPAVAAPRIPPPPAAGEELIDPVVVAVPAHGRSAAEISATGRATDGPRLTRDSGTGKARPRPAPAGPVFLVLARVALTFCLTMVAWIFFRAKSLHAALDMLGAVFSRSLFSSPLPVLRTEGVITPIAFAGAAIALLLAFEFVQRDKGYALEVEGRSAPERWAAYAAIVAVICCFRYTGSALDFIYFQF